MLLRKFYRSKHIDPMEATLAHSFTRTAIESESKDVTNDIVKAVHLLKASPKYPSRYTPPFETLELTNTTLVPSIVQAPNLELKHLTYAYLRENKTLPVIVAADLSLGEEEKLLRVLREHKTAIGWTIADIKGISPAKCMRQIYLEDQAKPTRDPQRRLNPHMKQVVKKEVLKLLDVSIIYPISDSKWVSLVQVV